MFRELLALFLLPALAAAQYGYAPPPGPSQSSGSTASATAPAVAPTAPANTGNQMNVCASFLACSDILTNLLQD
jgi:hypothetical protein